MKTVRKSQSLFTLSAKTQHAVEIYKKYCRDNDCLVAPIEATAFDLKMKSPHLNEFLNLYSYFVLLACNFS